SAPGGFYFSPTLVDGVGVDDELFHTEAFAPALTVTTFDSVDEAIELANATDYGLLAAVWTKSIALAHRAAARVLAGQVYVNSYGAGGGVELPFGGFKRSGYGREKGVEAFDACTA